MFGVSFCVVLQFSTNSIFCSNLVVFLSFRLKFVFLSHPIAILTILQYQGLQCNLCPSSLVFKMRMHKMFWGVTLQTLFERIFNSITTRFFNLLTDTHVLLSSFLILAQQCFPWRSNFMKNLFTLSFYLTFCFHFFYVTLQ